MTPYDKYLACQKIYVSIDNIKVELKDLSNDIIDKLIEKYRKRSELSYRLSGDILIDISWIKVIQSIKKYNSKQKLQKIC